MGITYVPAVNKILLPFNAPRIISRRYVQWVILAGARPRLQLLPTSTNYKRNGHYPCLPVLEKQIPSPAGVVKFWDCVCIVILVDASQVLYPPFPTILAQRVSQTIFFIKQKILGNTCTLRTCINRFKLTRWRWLLDESTSNSQLGGTQSLEGIGMVKAPSRL